MTSAQRAAMRRHKRRMEQPTHGLHGQRHVVKHGVCVDCGRRRQVVLPQKLCDRCCTLKEMT